MQVTYVLNNDDHQGGWENHFLIRKGRRVKLRRRPDWEVAGQDLWNMRSVCGVKLMTADRCDERAPFARAHGCHLEGGQRSSVRTDAAAMRTFSARRALT